MPSARPPRKPREKKTKGFKCPNCAAPLYVLDTRQRATGVIIRRRACDLCPFRITTEERPRHGQK